MGNIKVTNDSQSGMKHIVLLKPPYNVLGLDDLKFLRDEFLELSEPKNTSRVVLVRSEVNQVFCMGLDPHELLTKSAEERFEYFKVLAEMNIAALSSGCPIVCVVNGPAMAGGAVLAALADFRFFNAQFGKFSFSEVKVNLPVPQFVQMLAMRTVSPKFQFEMLAMGKNYEAPAALEIGFASQVYHDEAECSKQISELVSKLVRIDREVLRTTLCAANQHCVNVTVDFLKDPTTFKKFLGVEYFGAGLQKIV